MDRKIAKRLAPVMQAYAEGKTIQCLSKNNKTWNDIECPDFYPLYEYRVKPEWMDLKRGQQCVVKNFGYNQWAIRVFYGVSIDGKPIVYSNIVDSNDTLSTKVYDYCKPFNIEHYG